MAKKVRINKDACIGCGLCASMADGVLNFDDEGKANVILGDDSEIPESDVEIVEDAAASCPVQAIEIE